MKSFIFLVALLISSFSFAADICIINPFYDIYGNNDLIKTRCNSGNQDSSDIPLSKGTNSRESQPIELIDAINKLMKKGYKIVSQGVLERGVQTFTLVRESSIDTINDSQRSDVKEQIDSSSQVSAHRNEKAVQK